MIHVEVTADDIARGSRRDGECCPVARAVRRAGFPKAHVTRQYVHADGFNSGGRLFKLSAQLVRLIDKFDDALGMHPFSFEIRDDKASEVGE